MELSAVLTPSAEGGFVELNPETGTTTQVNTIELALANLREATALYIEELTCSNLSSRPRAIADRSAKAVVLTSLSAKASRWVYV